MKLATDLLENIENLNTEELAWLSGYCWARVKTRNPVVNELLNRAPVPDPELSTAATPRVLILSASQTGNARRVAEQLHAQLHDLPAEIRLESIGDYKNKNLAHEDIVLLVCSTQGEGEYPEEAIAFAKFLHSKRAPQLPTLSFAVLALGDSSYPLYCEAGKKLDEQFALLGATRLYERVDCDLDYEATATDWCTTLTEVLQSQLATATHPSAAHAASTTHALDNLQSASYTKERPYTATLISQQKITARSANKNVLHIEIDLDESGIHYQPGDSLGVYVKNDPHLVEAFLQTLQLDPSSPVQLKNGTQSSLFHALQDHLELTQNSSVLVKKWAAHSQHPELQQLLEQPTQLAHYAHTTPLLSMIQHYPVSIDAQSWVDFLRPLVPRMYSIASAQDEVDNEVHLSLAVVEYDYQNHPFTGVASHYLSQQLNENDELRVFVEANPRFRLPADSSLPIIMIGAGTGIAPYRAFMQQREHDEATGKAWLVFGNQAFIDDFLYQSEWQRWHKLGLLHKTSFAWSRQHPDRKEYVQHKLLENGTELWQWLQQGAHVYVCGDATHMAKAVEHSLLQVIREQGQLTAEAAEDYLDQLRETQRYQRDVY